MVFQKGHQKPKGAYTFQKGHFVSEKTRKKLSEQKKGDKNPAKRLDVRKKISKALKGKHNSPETEFKKGHHIGAEFKKGKNNLNWKGGGSYICRTNIKYKKWREKVLKRDDYTCQKCKERGENLISHHIKGWTEYPKLRYKVSNGLTLCKKCHIKMHKVRK